MLYHVVIHILFPNSGFVHLTLHNANFPETHKSYHSMSLFGIPRMLIEPLWKKYLCPYSHALQILDHPVFNESCGILSVDMRIFRLPSAINQMSKTNHIPIRTFPSCEQEDALPGIFLWFLPYGRRSSLQKRTNRWCLTSLMSMGPITISVIAVIRIPMIDGLGVILLSSNRGSFCLH